MSVFTYYRQMNAMDCGPTCLRMVAMHHGKHYNATTLRSLSGFGKSGVSLLGISDTAEKIGFRTSGIKITMEQLRSVPLPCILHWGQNHFVVLVDESLRGKGKGYLRIADPASGMRRYTPVELAQHWLTSFNENEEPAGIALLFEPSAAFYEQPGQEKESMNWLSLLKYTRTAKWKIVRVFALLLLGSLLQLLFPFLTQAMVDKGIHLKNIHFVVLLLIAQLVLTCSQAIAGFIRSRLLLKMSGALNLQILADFWRKLTRLPVSYFDIHHTGDTMQRINDHRRLQDFLTGTLVQTIFSSFVFAVYAVALVIYNFRLFVIFFIGSVIYFMWVSFFMKFRRKINYETFAIASKENDATLQLIQGMQEIRLNNAEKQKRWDWEKLQAKLVALQFRTLHYGQVQEAGAMLIIQIQGILISFMVASLVIGGKLTLGAMLALQYIIGQMSAPIQQWVAFVQNLQDAKISMERLNDIHGMDDEEDAQKKYSQQLPPDKTIVLQQLGFTYPGAGNLSVLDDINLVIHANKITAIVGASGSGKTTLLKLLLKVYEEYQGNIYIGCNKQIAEEELQPFEDISYSYWRASCGAVLQDGYIFNDSIANNIAVGVEQINLDRLHLSCRISNIAGFIESLPNKYETLLGADGMGISQGQKQRILIARAIYKDPAYLFFDEATNALDASNEREIIENLEAIFSGKTVVVVAHRLSTVRHADNIVVLDKGKIAETGTHDDLYAARGKYYELVKNQLELGN